jgi:hypothetical protein
VEKREVADSTASEKQQKQREMTPDFEATAAIGWMLL